ncbi:MAG: hypothetical protein JST14_12230 [Bacteroidetes bacterium]|nr:hypothetical protein [Bacteroidota bacterium]MBS1979344.1 hypothetical protein [Bacteroidota bacterium]
MSLHLTWKNILAFLVFAMLMGESHEIAHFIVGKIICGCWPESRDFNAWSLCKSCKDTNPNWYWPTIAGPVFSMTLAWIGMFMLRSPDTRKQSVGFALIWADVPQARIMTVLMGGGDEMVVMRNFTKGTFAEPHFKILSILLVFLMALPPIIGSFRAVKNRYGWLYNIGFMVLPLLVLGIYGFFLLNKLLANGFLAKPWIMGTPLFITLHTALMLLLFVVFFRKDLPTLTN